MRLINRPLLGVVSSHLWHNAFASKRWQNSLMSALSFAREKNAAILYSAATPYAAAIHNACVKTKTPAIPVVDAKTHTSLMVNDLGDHQLTVDSDCDDTSPEMRGLPFLDRLIVALSHQIFVLDIDPVGKIAKLIDRRLHAAEFPKGSVFIAQDARERSSRKNRWIQSQLDRGAVAWLVHDAKHPVFLNHCQRTTPFCQVPIFPVTLLPSSHSPFLVHCTRARRGAWPDQSPSQFYDELLIQPWESPPSTLQSLMRILQSKRLLATLHLKSGTTPTVSFTQRSLRELITARTFESHLARWDWEPYGIMVRREWLAAAGCRPVTYLRKDEIKQVTTDDLPFTQPYDESKGTERKGRDWRVEQEWRLPDDLRLHQISFSDAIVFVKHHWEAKLLSTVSQWPVCYTDA